ncbi:uncharacterized protein LOC133198990 [Saccostrea echinata]|uniref:uncharacterized protein LOC133198990 n=1 Tax=Saccostrea echinata TaxID=191078 RepID=UPI002A840358|nr:uncharacterized protein LOC133198990 [Saccostrea echinata]
MDLVQRPCSVDDSFEFIDFPETENKTKDASQGPQPENCVSCATSNQNSVNISSQKTTDSISRNGCEKREHSSQQSNVPTSEKSDKLEQDIASYSSCSCNQSCSSHNHNSKNQSPSLSQESENEGDQSECMCSDNETTTRGRLGSYAGKKPHFLKVNSKALPTDDNESLPTPVKRRGDPLSRETFEKLFDKDGRLVDEHAFRKCIFMGGVEPDLRKQAWQFLFGLYPCTSTTREREELLLDYIMKYHEMKSRWKTMLVLNAHPGATLLQQGLVARYQIEDQNNTIRSPDHSPGDHISEFEMMEKMLMDGKMKAEKPDFKVLSRNFDIDVSSPEMQQKIDFMKIQAQVYVNRQKISVKNLLDHLRVIDKDVPRTDRDLDYFKGTMNPNLTVLRNILLTFVAFHPQIGYAQGMNDILAQFLVVFDSEVEAYWCFRNYLQKIQHEFTEEGMVSKIELVVLLLQEMDPALLEHLKANDLGDLLFCHRWLLLGFKREFSFMESLRCFEILSSHHLELTSMEAEKTRRQELKREFESQGGVSRSSLPSDVECQYTFDLFMCVALLQECRPQLMECTDTAAVYSVINSLKINLDEILLKSAGLFYMYCKKSVEESFLMVDPPVGSRTPTNKRRVKSDV